MHIDLYIKKNTNLLINFFSGPASKVRKFCCSMAYLSAVLTILTWLFLWFMSPWDQQCCVSPLFPQIVTSHGSDPCCLQNVSDAMYISPAAWSNPAAKTCLFQLDWTLQIIQCVSFSSFIEPLIECILQLCLTPDAVGQETLLVSKIIRRRSMPIVQSKGLGKHLTLLDCLSWCVIFFRWLWDVAGQTVGLP